MSEGNGNGRSLAIWMLVAQLFGTALMVGGGVVVVYARLAVVEQQIRERDTALLLYRQEMDTRFRDQRADFAREMLREREAVASSLARIENTLREIRDELKNKADKPPPALYPWPGTQPLAVPKYPDPDGKLGK